MDERQTEIRQGAGLEESRINQDFVDFLNKWSTPVLVLILIVSASWWAYQKYQVAQVTKVNSAFSELATLTSSDLPNPESLVGLAETYTGVRSVPELAKLAAADVIMSSVRRGIPLGTELTQDGKLPEGASELSEDDRTFNLDRAGRLYKEVLDATRGDAKKVLLAINAACGVAAVAESKGEGDAARAAYADASGLAEKNGYDALVRAIQKRSDNVGNLATLVELPSDEQIPALPGTEPEPVLPDAPVDAGPELPGSSLMLPGTAPAPLGTGDESPEGSDPLGTDEE